LRSTGPAVIGYHFDGAVRGASATGLVLGVPTLVEVKFSTSVISVRVGGGTAATASASPVTPITGALNLGANWNATAFLQGILAEPCCAKVAYSAGDTADIRAAYVNRYGAGVVA
ncbi:MAG TPA: hypothetical protein VIY48_16535, partial [Candidatus Paceibacterota bacterium]